MRPVMSREEMQQGLSQGRTLIQEEWSTPDEKRWVDELEQEGICRTTPWEYKDTFQCERRLIYGIRKI